MIEHDESDSTSDQVPAFDDPASDEVRGLLAAAAVDQPMPGSVAATLDETLAALVHERAQDEATLVPGVVGLRRKVPLTRRLLVAAAAVVLIGGGAVGLNQVLQDESVSTASDATAATGATGATGTTSGQQAESPAAPEAAAGGKTFANGSAGSTLALTQAGFRQQAAVLAEALAPLSSSYDGQPSSPGPGDQSELAGEKDSAGAFKVDLNELKKAGTLAPNCPGPQVDAGTRVFSITFNSRPATLAIAPVANGVQYVAAWSCDGSVLLASADLPR